MALETQNYEDFQPQNEVQEPSIEASLDALGTPDRAVTESETDKLDTTLGYMQDKYGSDGSEFQLAQSEAIQVQSEHQLEARDIRKPKVNLSKEIMSSNVDSKLSLTLEQNFWPDIINIDESILDWVSQEDALKASKYFVSNDLSQDEKNQLEEFFQIEDVLIDVEFYFEENGYPVDRETFNEFLYEFSTYFEVKNTIKDDKKEQLVYDEASLIRLKEIYEWIPQTVKKELANEWLQSIELFESLPDSYEQLKDILKDPNNGELEKILLALKQEDKKNGNTEYFDTFSASLSSIDPSFEARITAFEASYDDQNNTNDSVDSLPDAQILWAIPEGATEIQDHDPDTISFREEDGTITKINTKDGTVSTSIDGGWYEIKNKLPTADFYGAKVEYEAKIQEIQPQLNTIGKLRAYIQELPQALSESFPLKKVKEGLIRMATAGWLFEWGKNTDIKASIINAGDLNDIKTTLVAALMKAKDDLESDKEEAGNKYIARLKKQLKPYSERMDSGRNEKKVVLQNIQEMWVLTWAFNQDLLDASIIPHIDNPTTSVVLKSGIVSWFSLNPFKIEWDLSLPDNPIDKDGNMDQRYRVILAELFNKMISWDSSQPIDLQSVSSASSAVIMKQNWEVRADETQYVNELLWDYPTQRALDNLEKPEPEEV